MAETDLSDWFPIADAAHVIGCSTRTVERLARARKLEQRLRRQEGTPPVAVYNPEDVDRIASERHPAPAPFVLPSLQTGNGNGHRGGTVDATSALARPRETGVSAEDLIRQFFVLAVQALQSPPSPPSPPVSDSVAETLYVTVKEAAAILGLPQADVQRLCHDGDLNHRLTGRGGIRIRRKDLEQL